MGLRTCIVMNARMCVYDHECVTTRPAFTRTSQRTEITVIVCRTQKPDPQFHLTATAGTGSAYLPFQQVDARRAKFDHVSSSPRTHTHTVEERTDL